MRLAGPERSHLGAVGHRPVDPVAFRDADPFEQRVRGGALHPVRAGVDRVDREREVAEHGSGEDERVAPRDEQEERPGREPGDEHDVVEPRQRDRVLHVPERDDHQRVRAHLELEEALEGDQRRQDGGDQPRRPRREQSGGGAPRSIQTSSAIRRSGATTNMFRSSIAPAKREAKAATTSSVQAARAIVATTSSCARASSERARAARRMNAATGKMPT